MCLPTITSAKLIIIKQFTLTNFVEKYQDINKQFNFLVDSDDYIKYYQNIESLAGNAEENWEPREIFGWGPLIPLRKKHTLRSYWKSFRLPSNMQNKTKKELFLLLPLKVKIPIKSVKANGKEFKVKSYIYLFPFGSGCINVEIDLPNLKYSIDNFSDLISNLMIAHFSLKVQNNGKGFKAFSFDIVKTLNEALFANEEGITMNDKNYSYIFLDTSIPLSLSDPEHKKGIAAIMTTRHIDDLDSYQIEKALKCKFKECKTGEILIFSPYRTLIYPSSLGIKNATGSEKVNEEKSKRKKIMRKYKCMCNNYCSFINVIFAVNGFLKSPFLEKKDMLPEKRVIEINKCFTAAFLKKPEGCYEDSFSDIASSIGLNEHLEKLTGKFDENN
jgi:hypothetical protein